ncbi:MAG: metallophosphoesterase family protein [Archangium sp.]
MSRTIVIGDLHGCADEALELLNALQATSSDRIIFAGDLVDRGPKPRECVELAMRHECVLGNHEEKHLQQRHSKAEKLSPAHLFTREQLSDEHYDFFAKLPSFIRLPEFNAAVVHAGAFPGVPLEQQKPNHLLHIQNINPPGTKSYWPSKAPADFTFWTNHWKGPERLIFGHSVLDKPLVTEWAVGVDTGAVFGRGLTALVLPSWELVTLPTSHRPRGGKAEVATFRVHGDVMAFS